MTNPLRALSQWAKTHSWTLWVYLLLYVGLTLYATFPSPDGRMATALSGAMFLAVFLAWMFDL